MDMVTIRAAMAKKVVGIPVGIIAVVVAGIILFVALRMKSSNTDTTDTSGSADTPSTDANPTDSTQQPDFQAIPQVTSVTTDTTDPTTETSTTAAVSTNQEWERQGINWAITQGFTVDVATSALTKYLDNEKLSTAEQEIRDKVVGHFGIPPQAIPGGATPTGGKGTNAPASKQGEPPVTHVVMGSRDNTPAELARIYYGTNSQDAQNKIEAKNDTITSPYTVGTKVQIPANYAPKYFVASAHINSQYDIARHNGTTSDKVEALNPHIDHWPVKPGTRVRVH